MSSVVTDFQSAVTESPPPRSGFDRVQSRRRCSSGAGQCADCRISARGTGVERQAALLERSLDFIVNIHAIERSSQPVKWAKLTMDNALVWYELGVIANCRCGLIHASKLLAAGLAMLPWYRVPAEWLRYWAECRLIRHRSKRPPAGPAVTQQE